MPDTVAVRKPPIDLSALTTKQKLDLIGKLWDSIDEGEPSPLTKAQRRELDRRIAEYEKSRDPGVPWSVVRDRILRRKR